MTVSYTHLDVYKRQRQSLWVKGETSGHYQHVQAIRIDCDQDTILLEVKQVGAACHTGHYSLSLIHI